MSFMSALWWMKRVHVGKLLREELLNLEGRSQSTWAHRTRPEEYLPRALLWRFDDTRRVGSVSREVSESV